MGSVKRDACSVAGSTIALLCSLSFPAESLPAHSFSTRVCALRDIEITTLIDDYREIAEFPSAALTRAAFQQVRARRLCKNAKVIRSLLIYDAMERDLGRIEERLNARDSGYQRVRRPYP